MNSLKRIHPISGGSDGDEAALAAARAREEAEKKGTAGTPTFVPSEEFKQFQATITDALGKLTDQVSGFVAAASRPAPGASAKPEPLVTEEEIDEAATTGQGVGKKVLQRINQTERRVAAAIEGLRAQGTRSIAQFARNQALAAMPLYQRFKDELEAEFKQLAPEHTVLPAAYTTVYEMVVGRHTAELVEEAKQAALRAPAPEDEGGTGEPTRAGRSGGGSGKVPTVQELLGENAVDALRSKGITADQHAQRLGFKDWPDMVREIQAQRAG